MATVGRPKKDTELTRIKDELLKMNRPQLKTKTGKERAPVSMFTGVETKYVERLPKDATRRVIEWLKGIAKDEQYAKYSHKFPRVSELSAKDAEEMKLERDLVSSLNKKLQKYFGMKETKDYEQEQEDEEAFGVPSQASTEMPTHKKRMADLNDKIRRQEEAKAFGVPSQESTVAPPSKKGRVLRKKYKASDIDLGENPAEPVEEKLKREINKQTFQQDKLPKVVINAPPVEQAKLPKAFSYVQEPVGLQERPPQASPILSFSNKDFKATPMTGDVSSLPEKDRLDLSQSETPVSLSQSEIPEQRPIMTIPQFGDMAGYEFSQYQGYRPIVNPQNLEAKYDNEPMKDDIGAIQVNMIRNASGNNEPSRSQKYASENEPIKEGGVMVQSLQDEIYTPEDIFRIRNMPPEEFTQFIQGKSAPRKALRFQPLPTPPAKPLEPINRERMGQPHAYTEDELKVLRAENAQKVMTELTEARANREQDKTIGNRENTGLATRFSIPGKDLITKPEEEIKKSIGAFANMSWIEDGARADSKLGRYSSLQQMVDKYEESRFTDVYTPISVQPMTRQYLYEMYKRDIEGITNNRRIPEYDGQYTQERVPEHERDLRAYGARPVGSRYPTLNNIEDYTYDHCCVVGTQNLGMSNQYQDYTRPYYRDDHLQFPNTIFEHRTHKQRFI